MARDRGGGGGRGFVVGGVAGWMARGASAAAPSAFETFTTEALGAHQLYIAEVRHPIEVRAGEEHLLPWLSRRVGTTLRAPDLDAFSLKLLGGRLLPGPNGPAALFMYESPTGERFTIYCSRAKQPRTALRYTIADQVARRALGRERDRLCGERPGGSRAAACRSRRRVYEQIENRSPTRGSAGRLISRRRS